MNPEDARKAEDEYISLTAIASDMISSLTSKRELAHLKELEALRNKLFFWRVLAIIYLLAFIMVAW